VGWTEAERSDRRFKISKSDQRREFERDRDRLLYSSAFHRLAGITQIVRAGELDIFHTRQQHTYKVAQIGRRLAERCVRNQPDAASLHGVDPEVVEAACLAHDLGHPPFGHAAETELDKLVRRPADPDGEVDAEPGADADPDGYEGNAQTFRILTKLGVRYGPEQCPGLDLTRATLAATLKYPWLRDSSEPKKAGKWSAYRSEEADFAWAREHCVGEFKSAEAELMDWADDIAYSVHDLEDFHRVGVIPWTQILSDFYRDTLVQDALKGWFNAPTDAPARIRDALDRIKEILIPFPTVTREVYDGSREQRRQLRNLTSILIGRFVRQISLCEAAGGRTVRIGREAEDEVRLLKHFARHYVIGLPALHAQQYGQKKIVRELFNIFLSEGKAGNLRLFPARLRYIWQDHADKPARLAADCIATLTENEAYQLHRRLTGANSGIVLDPIVR
jgi:dGTPase